MATGDYETVFFGTPTRGRGISGLAVLTGVIVAIGATAVAAAVASAALLVADVEAGRLLSLPLTPTALTAAAIMAGAQFLAYLWGGYAAGRMARLSGTLNGVLVPVVALLLAVLLGAVSTLLARREALPVSLPTLDLTPGPVSWPAPAALGILLVTMFLGGLIGGALGGRWHRKLERRLAEAPGPGVETKPGIVDLRETSVTTNR